MPNETIDQLKDAIIDSVQARAKDFLEANKDAKDFLAERAKRLAELAVEYTLAEDEAEQEAIKEKMSLVRQTMSNEVSALAMNAQAEAKNFFASLLGTAMDVLIKALPTIVAAI